MNHLEICGKAIGEVMRGKPYQNLTIDDLRFMGTVVCKLETNELKLMFLRLNKHTRTGSLSFSYTNQVIQAIQNHDESKLLETIASRDWPEVFDNPDLTSEEMDALERISIEETKIVRNAMYAALCKENADRTIFTTCDTRREIVKGKKLSIYEDCYNLCFQNKEKKEIPNYLSNVVPVEREVVKEKAVVHIKTEVCYFFYDVLDHLFSDALTSTGTLSLTADETKIIREALDFEYRIYRNYRNYLFAY